MLVSKILRCALPAYVLLLGPSAAMADAQGACLTPLAHPSAARLLACDAALSQASDPQEQAQMLVKRAQAHRSLHNPEAALADLTEAERLVPEMDPQLRTDLLVERSEVHRLTDDFDAALTDLAEAERLTPGDADPLANRALVLHDQGDYDAAMEQINQALQLEPGHERATLLAMHVLGNAGDPQQCLKYGDKAVQIAPERPQTWAWRGRCLVDLERHEEAVADMERAAAIGLDEEFLYSNLSLAHLRLGQWEEARAAAQRAVEIDPMSELAVQRLASALAANGAPEEAAAVYGEALARGIEDNEGTANSVAWDLYVTGRADLALPIMQEWLAAHPEPTAEQSYELDTAAHILAAVGRQDEALDLFLQAAELGGPEQRAFYEERLTALGFAPDGTDAGFGAALRACVAAGSGCKLY